MNHAPLVEITRGRETECVHYGSVAVVDAAGKLLYCAGDPNFLTFTRSTLKPFQAAPFIRARLHEKFNFNLQELALMCASHSGEDMHLAVTESILKKVGAQSSQLRCGCHVPMQYSAFDLPAPAGLQLTQLHNNCSGKHAGFLGFCTAHNLPLDSYLEPTHALQQQVRTAVAHFAGMKLGDLKMGIDGCSAPNYALPLSRVAHLYAQLAQGTPDAHYGDTLPLCFEAMTTHPELVSGTGRNDLAFMQTAPGDWVAKIGADGVQVIGVRSAEMGIAIKVADGNMRALYTTAVAVLQQLGLVKDVEHSPLAPWVQPTLKNFMGLTTGQVRAVVKLQKV
jgi:L-asparaginase II